MSTRPPPLVLARHIALVAAVSHTLTACGGNAETDNSGAPPATPDRAAVPGPPPKSPTEMFDELLAGAVDPIVTEAVIKEPGDRYGSHEFVFRMAGTKAVADLNRSELLFAFLAPTELPALDLVADARSFAIGHKGIVYDTPFAIEAPVFYADLRGFAAYHGVFMDQHDTPLRRQAAVGEFTEALREAHATYREIVEAAKRTVYRKTFRGVVIEPSHYDVSTGTLTVPLDGWEGRNTAVRDLVAFINGDYHCISGSANTDTIKSWWSKFVVNVGAARTIQAAIDLEEAEIVIAATAKKPATVEFIFQPDGLVQGRCGTTNRTSVSARVLALRLRVEAPDGPHEYSQIPGAAGTSPHSGK